MPDFRTLTPGEFDLYAPEEENIYRGIKRHEKYNMTFKEIAIRLSIEEGKRVTEDAVRMVYNRAIEKLKRNMDTHQLICSLLDGDVL